MASSPSPRKHTRAKKHAEIENISIAGTVSRMGPSALWFYAKSYLNAGRALPAPEAPYEPVRYYVTCHSIELALKAYLSLKGDTMLKLAENAFGHNLTNIFAHAEAQGILSEIPLTNLHCDEIQRAAEYYGEKVFEYPAVGEAIRAYPRLPDLSLLLEAAEVMCNCLEAPCREV